MFTNGAGLAPELGPATPRCCEHSSVSFCLGRGCVCLLRCSGWVMKEAWDLLYLPSRLGRPSLSEAPAPLLYSSKPVFSLPQLNLARGCRRKLGWGPWTFPFLCPSWLLSPFPPIPHPLPYVFSFFRGWVLLFGRGRDGTRPCHISLPSSTQLASAPGNSIESYISTPGDVRLVTFYFDHPSLSPTPVHFCKSEVQNWSFST